jgi:hypothetical protein
MTQQTTPDDTPLVGGNPASRIRDALMRELEREVEDNDGRIATQLELIARALIDKGAGGDVVAIREVFDRTGGKTTAAPPDTDAEPQKVMVGWMPRTS